MKVEIETDRHEPVVERSLYWEKFDGEWVMVKPLFKDGVFTGYGCFPDEYNRRMCFKFPVMNPDEMKAFLIKNKVKIK